MKVFQINTCGNLSTGGLAVEIARGLIRRGDDSIVAYARNEIAQDVPCYKIGNQFDVLFHAMMTRLTDRTGFFSKDATCKLIDEIKGYNPDIIQLHNLHGYYLNIQMLFDFLKEYQKPVVWTLHDCWAFTGHCAYFDYVQCEKWKAECYKCPNRLQYPKSFIDNASENYEKKKNLFTSVTNLTLVVPSVWLRERVEKSFLQSFPVKVVYNGIDLEQFNYEVKKMQFRQKNHIDDKIIILGVASVWSERKGLETFVQLSKRLTEPYRIVLVGLSAKQKKKLPPNIIGIERVESKKELAEIYADADIFLNPSKEETFGLTTIEALACGTYSIVLRDTACAEIAELNGGKVVDGTIESIERAIYSANKVKNKPQIDERLFSKEVYVEKMLDIYNHCLTK